MEALGEVVCGLPLVVGAGQIPSIRLSVAKERSVRSGPTRYDSFEVA